MLPPSCARNARTCSRSWTPARGAGPCWHWPTQILNRSRSVYEEAHRPAVIEKAEYFFKAWTDGRYRRIIAPLGEDVRSIERRDGVEVGLSGLSRGTSEQLYLALRFGLVQHFVETSGEPLPIVMDDILVNFDADRAERAARSIEELAETCQIIYFTCHVDAARGGAGTAPSPHRGQLMSRAQPSERVCPDCGSRSSRSPSSTAIPAPSSSRMLRLVACSSGDAS